MTVIVSKNAVNLREELASLRNQGGYEEQQFWFAGLVTNGTFDADTNWTKGTGWSISGGTANKTAGTGDAIYQPAELNAGKTYRIVYTVSGATAGTCAAVLTGGTQVTGTLLGTNTTRVELLTANTGNVNVGVTSNATFDGSIDNISVYEVDANDDVVHRLPKGWKPKDVFEDGLLQREGAAHDYEVVYDGFDYYVKPAVAPSATTQTCVIGVRK